MDNMEIVLRAISFASRKHDGQLRKDGKTPYVSHVFRVSMILWHVFGVADEKVLAAAVLHDIIEDTTADFDEIDKEFGRDVACWVSLLTKDKRKEEKDRERDYSAIIGNAQDEVKLIKLADIYDNILDSRTVKSPEQFGRTLQKTGEYLRAIRSMKSERIVVALERVEQLIKNEKQIRKEKNGKVL